METPQPYSLVVFLAKLLANRGAALSAILGVLVAAHWVPAVWQTNLEPVIQLLSIVVMVLMGSTEAKKDLQDYLDYIKAFPGNKGDTQ